MANSEPNIIKPEDQYRGGRAKGQGGKFLRDLHRITEERCQTHYDMLDKLASEGDKECAMFLINKVLPNAKGSRTMKIELTELVTLDDVAKNQDMVFKHVSEGNISIEEGEKLFALTDIRRKTIEQVDLVERIEEINKRMKEAGI